ncbi:hypothetical protein [Neisseria polysaccharea]|uniref:hypothetical protein n=1 Tax=Neisseria polysaccharea TaxID=489 RepID=UPI00046DE291
MPTDFAKTARARPVNKCRLKTFQTAFLMHLPFTGTVRAQENTRTVIPDNTVILKLVIPAQAGI